MRKFLLVLLLLLSKIAIVGGEDTNEIITEKVESNVLNESFAERTKEVVDFMNQDNGYGIPRT